MDKKTIIIMILEAIIFIGILICVGNCSNKKIETLDQNLIASHDKIEELTLENGNLLAEKSSYIIKEKELYDIIDITKQEKKELEKKLDSKIAYISEIESNVKIDTIETVKDSIIYMDSSIITKFSYDDDWLSFNGISDSKSQTTNIYDISIPSPFKVGLTDDYNIFIIPGNPYINITEIEGAVIDGSNLYPKKQKWNLSIHGGIGVHYGLFGQVVDVGPYIGVGTSYNF